MLKFSVLVLACLYSQAGGLYFGRYDVVVRSVGDLGDEKTRNDTSELVPVISTALVENGKKLVPNPAELVLNITGATEVNAPISNIAKVVNDAAGQLGKAVEATVEDTATLATGAKPARVATATAKIERATKIFDKGNGTGAATENAEATTAPPTFRRNAKGRTKRKSRQISIPDTVGHGMGRPIQGTTTKFTGLVGVENHTPHHIPSKPIILPPNFVPPGLVYPIGRETTQASQVA